MHSTLQTLLVVDMQGRLQISLPIAGSAPLQVSLSAGVLQEVWSLVLKNHGNEQLRIQQTSLTPHRLELNMRKCEALVAVRGCEAYVAAKSIFSGEWAEPSLRQSIKYLEARIQAHCSTCQKSLLGHTGLLKRKDSLLASGRLRLLLQGGQLLVHFSKKRCCQVRMLRSLSQRMRIHSTLWHCLQGVAQAIEKEGAHVSLANDLERLKFAGVVPCTCSPCNESLAFWEP